MTPLSPGTDRELTHGLTALDGEEARTDQGYTLVRIGEFDDEYVMLSVGRHTLVLTIQIDQEWSYRVTLPLIDVLQAIQAETKRNES